MHPPTLSAFFPRLMDDMLLLLNARRHGAVGCCRNNWEFHLLTFCTYCIWACFCIQVYHSISIVSTCNKWRTHNGCFDDLTMDPTVYKYQSIIAIEMSYMSVISSRTLWRLHYIKAVPFQRLQIDGSLMDQCIRWFIVEQNNMTANGTNGKLRD